MSKLRIFTVGLALPGDDFEEIDFGSDQTLLDADIILFEPSLGECDYEHRIFNGMPVLSEHSSFTTKRQLDHWRSEIHAAVGAGKLVVVYLTKPQEACRYTGEKNFSGTGRSRVTTDIVTAVSSYEAVPVKATFNAKSGSSMLLTKEAALIAAYWSEFANLSSYQIELQGEIGNVWVRSRSGDRILGAGYIKESGALILLPSLAYESDQFVEKDEEGDLIWSKQGYQFGKRLFAALVSMFRALKESTQSTPPPAWVNDSKYRFIIEGQIEADIEACSKELSVLQETRSALRETLESAGSLRALLFEQGKPLERAVREALELFGFNAAPLTEDGSEFDAVITGPEGRCVGEVEGRDTKAIGIEKFSQLERNIQEDFSREGISDYAKPVLFGNAFRLTPLSDRADFFTAKVLTAAARTGTALVRTPDLFAPAKYLKENPQDVGYAAKCRNAIMCAKGSVVVFEPPDDYSDVPSQLEVLSPR